MQRTKSKEHTLIKNSSYDSKTIQLTDLKLIFYTRNKDRLVENA